MDKALLKSLLVAALFAMLAQAHAQPVEADLDGNAGALLASDRQPRAASSGK